MVNSFSHYQLSKPEAKFPHHYLFSGSLVGSATINYYTCWPHSSQTFHHHSRNVAATYTVCLELTANPSGPTRLRLLKSLNKTDGKRFASLEASCQTCINNTVSKIHWLGYFVFGECSNLSLPPFAQLIGEMHMYCSISSDVKLTNVEFL